MKWKHIVRNMNVAFDEGDKETLERMLKNPKLDIMHAEIHRKINALLLLDDAMDTLYLALLPQNVESEIKGE